MNNGLQGKTALVTGASRGIGRATALALAKAGANVAINYLTNEDMAKEVFLKIKEYGRRSIIVRADVSLSSDILQLISATEENLGTIDILVNNAGIGHPQKIEDITEQDWDETIISNLKSVFLVTQKVLPGMRSQKWGRIINMSSTAAHIGGIVGPHYAASKAGIIGLTHYYATQLAKEGITVNAVAPALIETEMVKSNPQARPGLIPMGRFGSVEEVGQLVVMLASNGYITGQTINIDGGLYMS